ncbi:MAG: hypothetical protein VX535_00290 [Pseudomonadota bacterium]|nr:hypothetical protein [Pseudomonadota bacterium]
MLKRIIVGPPSPVLSGGPYYCGTAFPVRDVAGGPAPQSTVLASFDFIGIMLELLGMLPGAFLAFETLLFIQFLTPLLALLVGPDELFKRVPHMTLLSHRERHHPRAGDFHHHRARWCPA